MNRTVLDQGGLNSGSMRNMNKSDLNPSVGFNSTSQRFGQFAGNKLESNPGPGSYDAEGASTIAQTVKGTQQALLNTLSSQG